jgi:hypothetical protein
MVAIRRDGQIIPPTVLFLSQMNADSNTVLQTSSH